MLYHRHETLVAPDGHDIHTQLWAPDGQASCVIQILHGLGEHSGRYARLAGRAVERGLAVCIHDHRGHGNHCDDLGHFAQHGLLYRPDLCDALRVKIVRPDTKRFKLAITVATGASQAAGTH